MRVLYVVHQFFPDHKTGTEVLTLNTAKGVLQRGCEVAVFTGFPSKNLPEDDVRLGFYNFEGVDTWCYKHDFIASEEQANIVESEYDNREAARYFKKVLSLWEPDIVHVYHFQRVSASVLSVCVDMSIPIVFTPTDFWFECPTTQLLLNDHSVCEGPDDTCANCLKHLTSLRLTGWKAVLPSVIPESLFSFAMLIARKVNINSSSPLAMAKALSLRESFLRKAFTDIDRILIPSKLMKRKIVSFLGDDENIVDIPFAIDLPEKMESVTSNALRLGFIGTISDVKGPHVITEAMMLIPTDINLEVNLYGDMEKFPHYSQLIGRHAEMDNRIKLRGTFPFEKINEVFSGIDALVLPSVWHENTPLVAYAAQAYGCPIIASRIEGLLDIINDGENGILFSPGSAEELADILQGLCASPEKLDLMAQRVTSVNSSENYIGALIDVYESVLKERSI